MIRIARLASPCIVLAAAASALTGCASLQGSTETAEAPIHFYCHQSRLHEFAGRLSCNWATDPEKACADPEPRNIARAATTGRPVKSQHQCRNGDNLVRVTVGENPAGRALALRAREEKPGE